MDIEEESPDLLNMEIDFGDKAKDEMVMNKDDDQYSQNIGSSILISDIPPEEWQRELEKVSSKLKMDYNANNYNTVEWRSHIDQIKTNEVV